MPDGGRTWFFDTVTLSNFAFADRLDLLIARYGKRAQITPEVLDEISEGVVAGYSALCRIDDAIAAGKLGSARPLTSAERIPYRDLLRTMSPGEASCVVCARDRGGVVVTDDRAARTCCSELGIAFTGTIGILKACCLQGTLDPQTADNILLEMVAAGYRSPVGRASDIL